MSEKKTTGLERFKREAMKDLPCLKCGKKFRTTISRRICPKCTSENNNIRAEIMIPFGR